MCLCVSQTVYFLCVEIARGIGDVLVEYHSYLTWLGNMNCVMCSKYCRGNGIGLVTDHCMAADHVVLGNSQPRNVFIM